MQTTSMAGSSSAAIRRVSPTRGWRRSMGPKHPAGRGMSSTYLTAANKPETLTIGNRGNNDSRGWRARPIGTTRSGACGRGNYWQDSGEHNCHAETVFLADVSIPPCGLPQSGVYSVCGLFRPLKGEFRIRFSYEISGEILNADCVSSPFCSRPL